MGEVTAIKAKKKEDECARCHKKIETIVKTLYGNACSGCAEYICALWFTMHPEGL